METDEEEMLAALHDENVQKEIKSTPDKNKRKRPHVTTTWSTKDINNLISTIEKHTCIWEYSSVDYKDRQKRENAWREVASKCPGHDVDECKAKWANVKTAYNSTKNKMATKSGQAACSTTPRWPFWTAMQFYHNHDREKTTESVSNLDVLYDNTSSAQFPTRPSSPSPSTSSKTTHEIFAQETSPNKILHQAVQLLQSDTEDKWHSFGMYLASQLRDMEKTSC